MKSFLISIIAILMSAALGYGQTAERPPQPTAAPRGEQRAVRSFESKHDSPHSLPSGRVREGVPRHHRHHYDPYYIEDPMFPTPVDDPFVDTWDVHEGVNTRVSVSATAGFGSRAPHGVGFGRTIDFLYVSPLHGRWNYAIGATTTGMDWGGYHYNDAALYGTVNYYASDKVRLSLTGYKSLLPNARGHRFNPYYSPYYDPYLSPFSPFSPYLLTSFSPYYYNPGQLDTYVGGDVHVKLKNNSWIEVHVGASTWNR